MISAYYLLAQLFLSRTPPSSHDDKEEEKEEDDEEEGDEREEVEDKKEEVEDKKEEVEEQEEEEGMGKKEEGEEEVAPKNIPANTATDKVLAAANLKVGLLLVQLFMRIAFSPSGPVCPIITFLSICSHFL